MTRTDHRPAPRPASGDNGLRAFGLRADERGVVSIIAASVLVLVIAVAAVVVDAGSLLLARRTLQTATDAAALAAATDLDNAQGVATTTLEENGYEASNISAATTGVYTADAGTSPGNRFAASSDPAQINAIRIETQANAPMYFSRALGMSSLADIQATATATISPTAAFGAGTQLAELEAGVINSILGDLLGTTVSLSVADYNALANARINALAFLDALATEVGLTAASTYGDLLDAQVSVGQILDAAIAVIENGSGDPSTMTAAISALNVLSGRVPPGTSVPIGDVVDASYFLEKSIGEGRSMAMIAALDLVEASVGSASTGRTVSVGLAIPNVTSANLAIGAPMKFAVGPVGTTVHTAQIRVAVILNATISVPLVLPSTGISVPVYIEGAQGTATASSIPCQENNLAELTGTAGTVTARFATVSDGDLVDFSSSPTPGSAQVSLAGYDLITISGSTTVAGAGPTAMTFSQVGQTQRISGTDPGSTLLSDLNSSLSVTPSIPLVTPLIATTATMLVQSLGTVLLPALQALGVHLGNLDMVLSGVKCTPVLVQ